MEATEIDVVIPVYRPDGKLRRLLLALMQQTMKPSRILLVNTEQSLFDEACLEGTERVEVIHIRKEEFDHGGTRHMAAMRLHGAFLLFLTQDAVPADNSLIERMYGAFFQNDSGRKTDFGEGRLKRPDRKTEEDMERPEICAVYARQLPAPDCSVIEKYTRSFNYGAESRVKTAADLPVLGIKTFFCSNVCAMYRRSAYESLGGFTRHTIFNEDMIFAGNLIRAGKAVAYCADAKVIHSHNYSGIQQFHRNFDLGVSQAEHPEVFGGIRSESEGIRMVKQTAGYLMKIGKPYLLPKLVWQSGWKFLGYRFGKNYKKLPAWMIRRFTMNPGYWKQENQNTDRNGEHVQ